MTHHRWFLSLLAMALSIVTLVLVGSLSSRHVVDARILAGDCAISFRVNGVAGPYTTVDPAAYPAQCAAALATATPPPPTVAASPVPVSGQPCPAWVHDRYVATGPDGKTYPTWHPAVDPQYGCLFGHEHGADPRTARANAALPAFGYIGGLVGDAEPHEGFKVFVVNQGDVQDGAVAPFSYRLVFHMGTSGVKRYTTRYHSAEYDYLGPLGAAHVAGMADTGAAVGSTCDNPRRGGRDFSTVGCADAYEIWSFHLSIHDPADPFNEANQARYWLEGAVAAFDPITTRNPQDDSQVIYTSTYRHPELGADPLAPASPDRGCRRESYGGPAYVNNAGRPTTYRTDAYGAVTPGGPLVQTVPAVRAQQVSYKLRADFCGGGVHAPN